MVRYAILMLCVSSIGKFVAAAEPVSLTIDPQSVVNHIDEKVYGHFLEHIYHSCNGGLWGELIWNRSFELNGAGEWVTKNGVITQRARGTNIRLLFGDVSWKDYEYTLEARKTGGQEGFLILFRVAGEDDFYWANLGGWGNKQHALERGRSDEQRWHTVGSGVDGAIEKGVWCKIKIRCAGNHFQVWLNGEQIIDFIDNDKVVENGRVGIGTWATQAEFRNFKVTDLNGALLHEGLPDNTIRQSDVGYWTATGNGQIALDAEDPKNGSFSQHLTCSSGEVGLEQTALCVRRSEVYRGSLWARGHAEKGVVVRLLDGDLIVAAAELGPLSADWKEHAIDLRPTRDVEQATLQIIARGQTDAWIDQVSLMPASWQAAGGFRPDLLQAIKDLRAPIIRWPGGCFASAYHWKDGIGPQSERVSYPIEIWDDRDVNSFGTDEFVAMCRQVGAEPLIVVNIGTPAWRQHEDHEQYLQDLLDWIEYCNGPEDSKWGKIRAANGHVAPYAVKYWEIDNETWHMGAEAYADAVNKIAPLMRQADPSIRLAACGSGGFDSKWNQTIIDHCAEQIDYLSIHHYENPDRFAEGPRAYEAFFEEAAKQIAASKNPKLKIYVSEWNAQSTDWRTGLYCGGLLNAFERCGETLTIGGPALFLRHVSAESWDNAFVNFDQSRWFPAPNYVVMKLWRDHYAADRIHVDGDAGPLNLVATRSPDESKLTIKVVNPTDQAISVRVAVNGPFDIQQASMLLIAPGTLNARNSLEHPRTIAPRPASTSVNRQTVAWQAPPLSAAVVTIRRQ